MSLPKTFDGHTLGDFIVREKGIYRITKVDDYAGYTSELILPKDIFIGAYNKYIKGDVDTQDEWIKKEDVIHLLERWADGYCYIEIPTDDAIKAIKEMGEEKKDD